jgi:hypothetical protein
MTLNSLRKVYRRYKHKPEISWHTLFIDELAKIINPNVYAELGIYEGETFLKVKAQLKYGVDISQSALDYIPDIENVIKILGTSEDLANELSEKLKCIDLLFIDANHDAKYVVNDFVTLEKYLSKKAIVLFHDTYPMNKDYTNPKFCGDAYLAIPELDSKFSGWSFITLPIHPGLTIASRNPNFPEWVEINP